MQQLAALPSPAWGWLLVPLGVAAAFRPRYFLPPLFLVAGFTWAVVRADLILAETLPRELEGVDIEIEAWVADLPVPQQRGVRLVVDVARASRGGVPVTLPTRLQLGVYDDRERFRVGDRWRLTVRLRQPNGFRNPGGFDYEAHLLQHRIRATGYVREVPPAVRLGSLADETAWHPAYWLNRYRQDLSDRLGRLLADHPFTGMVTAFANGADDAIPDPHWEILNRTGTSHLVAISGMNIGLVAGIAWLLIRWLWSLPAWTVLRVPAPRMAAVGALLAATGYAALAGFAIPTQRALVMLTAALGGMFLGRRTAPSVLLMLALFAVLIVDPLAVLAAGFWLSFLAVAVILFAAGALERGSWRERLQAWGFLQWAVALGLLPLLLLLFQQVSVSGPLANLLAIPVIEIVVIPATLAGVAASMVLPDFLAALPLQLAATTLDRFWPVLVWLADWRGALWVQHAPPLWAIGAAAIGVFVLLLPGGYPGRWLGVVWLLPLFTTRPTGPAPGEFRVTLLDVGQGLSAVVRTKTRTLVFDTGARFSARFDAGRAVLIPYLRQAGVRHIDRLIVSHGDNDHLGGAASLRAAMPVGDVLSSVPDRVPGATLCQAGQEWNWDGIAFRILHPPAGQFGRDNNSSCVLWIAGPSGRVLLPGDIAARAERQLVREQGDHLAAELLVVPHHGSKTSSTSAFLDAVEPRFALLAVGYRNRYRHPHPDVVRRYRDRKIVLADSASSGAIEFRFRRNGIEWSRYREQHRRYWHRRPACDPSGC